jgi:hypothetical protein
MHAGIPDRPLAVKLPVWRRLLGGVAPLLLLWLINYATFLHHYRRWATFPWDFMGGYHAQAFGWYDLGELWAPPAWLPWTDMGFPAFIAIQSGGWYLPLALLHAMGVVYSIHVATMVQVAHVLFGAIGAYVLARRLGLGTAVALVAGVAYHFSATFYSNQQHVDIVRLAAWVPWILFSLHPRSFERRWLGVPLGAIILSQLLVSGYPGGIVATAYGCIVWVLVYGFGEQRARRNAYFFGVACVGVAGALMAMPKWLPLVLNGSAGISVDPVAPLVIDHRFLLTFLMPYDTPVLDGDITMRSFWLPLTALWGLAYVDVRERSVRAGLALTLLALVLALKAPHVHWLLRSIPGLGLSRFPISDWRAVLHIGIIVASMCGWARLLDGRCGPRQTVFGTLSALVVSAFAMIAAIQVGFDAPSLVRVIGLSVFLTATLIALPLLWRDRFQSRVWRPVAVLVLFFATGVEGYVYYRAQPTTWAPSWTRDVEQASLAGTFNGFMAARTPGVTTTRRPERLLYGSTPEEAVRQHNVAWYNQCWYMHTYCVFGYNNLKMSTPHKIFFEAVQEPGGADLLKFAARQGQLLVVRDRVDSIPPLDDSSGDATVVGDTSAADVRYVSYGPDFASYQINARRDIRVVENEIGWPGWKVRFCGPDSRCSVPTQTGMTAQGLRTWTLPTGDWTVKLRFVPPSSLPGYLCLLSGILIALGYIVFVHGHPFRRRRPLAG